MLGAPVEITSDKDPAWLTISLFCIKQVHNKLLTLLAIILEFGALVCSGLQNLHIATTESFPFKAASRSFNESLLSHIATTFSTLLESTSSE
ncbi:hypothetical protein JHK85_028128 [Glycine max]|nr:hypothetical protein JHK85_028128 [Glycine max]